MSVVVPPPAATPAATLPAAPLPVMDTGSRIDRLRTGLAAAGVEALVVTSLTNIRYLTGFTGSAGMLLVADGAAVLVTDGRYGQQAPEQMAAAGVAARCEVAPAVEQRGLVAGLAGAMTGRLGLEAAHVSWARQRSFATDWFPGRDLVATVGLVEDLRRVKDKGELARVAAAAAVADAALAEVRPLLVEGPRELDVAHALDAGMRRLGASGPSFETIVAAGPNAARPHHRPGPDVIRRGEAVVVDFGAEVDGYRSDMTRTVWVDELADPTMRRVVQVVAASQAAGVAAVAAGVAAADVDRACREVIAGAGWADEFLHGTGHGVGLDIHEAPSVAATSADTLAAGHVVTVEPGVYLPGLGGVRIEDTVVVAADGCRTLTFTVKDLP